jgi:RNA polymerase sigma factor (sigma-70 family)
MAASGNIAAFELLYERYHRRTYSLCLRMTSSQTESEDLTQEVFIQLFRKVGSFRGESAFSTVASSADGQSGSDALSAAQREERKDERRRRNAGTIMSGNEKSVKDAGSRPHRFKRRD